MYINILRGTSHIGGNIIEIGTAATTLLFDCGAMLNPPDDIVTADPFSEQGLTFGSPRFDAVFLSHHHGDHCALASRILPSIPVFSGSETQRILTVIADFTNSPPPKISQNFVSGVPFQIGDITITPISTDHSAKDAYMFLIEGDNKHILYTGDYRATSSTSTEILRLLDGAPLDVLLTEGTNISPLRHSASIPLDENALGKELETHFRTCPGTVFFLCSSTNENRITTVQNVARATGRRTCEDLFLTSIRNRVESGVQSFQAHFVNETSPRIFPYFQKLHKNLRLVGAKTLARFSKRDVIFVRTSMLQFVKNFLDSRPKNEQNLLIYSLWQGYRKSADMKAFLEFFESQKIPVLDLHTSGHASRDTITQFIQTLHPKTLIPIHCESDSRSEFLLLHPNCRLLTDYDVYSVE